MSIRKEKPSRVRRSPEESRDNILAAAERLLTESGPQSLRLADVAKEAGVANATVLHHFGTIDGVHKALMERMISELVEQVLSVDLPEDPAAARKASLIRLFDAFEQKNAARLAAWLELTDESRRLTSVREAVHRVAGDKFPDQSAPIELVESVMLLGITLALGAGFFGPTLGALLGKPERQARDMILNMLFSHIDQLEDMLGQVTLSND